MEVFWLFVMWGIGILMCIVAYMIEYIEKYVPKDDESGLPIIITPRYRYEWQEKLKKIEKDKKENERKEEN